MCLPSPDALAVYFIKSVVTIFLLTFGTLRNHCKCCQTATQREDRDPLEEWQSDMVADVPLQQRKIYNQESINSRVWLISANYFFFWCFQGKHGKGKQWVKCCALPCTARKLQKKTNLTDLFRNSANPPRISWRLPLQSLCSSHGTGSLWKTPKLIFLKHTDLGHFERSMGVRDNSNVLFGSLQWSMVFINSDFWNLASRNINWHNSGGSWPKHLANDQFVAIWELHGAPSVPSHFPGTCWPRCETTCWWANMQTMCHGTRWTSLGAQWSKKQSTVDTSWDRNPTCLRMEMSNLRLSASVWSERIWEPPWKPHNYRMSECLATLVKHSSTWIFQLFHSCPILLIAIGFCNHFGGSDLQHTWQCGISMDFRPSLSVGVQLLPFNDVFLLRANIYCIYL